MSLQENVTAAIGGHNEMAVALAKIALGRPDGGRPLGGETSRQIARETLTALGLDWNHVLKVHEEMQPAYGRLRRRRGP